MSKPENVSKMVASLKEGPWERPDPQHSQDLKTQLAATRDYGPAIKVMKGWLGMKDKPQVKQAPKGELFNNDNDNGNRLARYAAIGNKYK